MPRSSRPSGIARIRARVRRRVRPTSGCPRPSIPKANFRPWACKFPTPRTMTRSGWSGTLAPFDERHQTEEHMITNLIRRGLYALPLSGVLTAVPWLFIMTRSTDLKRDPEAYARGLISASHVLGGYLYLAGLISLLFGVLALYGVLAGSRRGGLAAVGMIFSVVAVAMLLSVVGILLLAQAVLADVYLAGNKDVAEALTQLSGGTLSNRITTYIGVLVTAVGFVLSVTLTPGVAWLGALGLIVGGLGLARDATRGPVAAGTSDSTERPNTHVASASA